MRTVSLDRWRFLPSDEVAARAKGHDDSSWREVEVPHDWSVEQDFSPEASSGTGYLPGGIAWYRAHLSLAELALRDGQHVRLRFHGVYKNSDVWVNGYHFGGRPSGHTAFSFDLSEILGYAPDDDLVISVRVEHTDISDSRWYNGSGITRKVELEVHEAVRVPENRTLVTTVSADAGIANLRIDQTVANDTAESRQVGVHHQLRSLSDGSVHSHDSVVEVAAGAEAELSLLWAVPDPQLWSDTDPRLYRLSTTLSWAESGVERQSEYELVTGLRTFAFDADRGFFLNGEQRLLKGVCLHEDAGPFGVAVPTEVWLRRLLSLQEMGCNAIRMAHNPHAPELYELCDALGFLVFDEAFDEWENPKNKWWQGHNVYPPRHEGYAHVFPEWHERDLTAMIEAHRHHPSIVAWSIGNEIDYPNDPYASPLFAEMVGNNDANKPAAERLYDPNRPDARRLTTIAARLAEIARAADPSRPVTVAAAFPEMSSRTGLLDPVDLVGYNYKEHLYEEDHGRFPGKPFVGSENGHRYSDWRHVLEKDYIAGQFLWTGIDYLGEAHGWPIHGSGAGLITLAGLEKPGWHLRRSWWSTEPIAYLATRAVVPDGEEGELWSHPVSRLWEVSSGDPVEILCFSNAEDLRLSCGGEAIVLERDEERGYWSAVAVPRAEPLVVEALRAGAVVAQDELVQRGDAARLEAELWSAPADALSLCSALTFGDTVQIVCTLRDADGSPARDERVVAVSVEGGELIGLENGDLGDVTSYSMPSRRTLDGRLVVFVKPSSATTVRIVAEGLPPVSVECAP